MDNSTGVLVFNDSGDMVPNRRERTLAIEISDDWSILNVRYYGSRGFEQLQGILPDLKLGGVDGTDSIINKLSSKGTDSSAKRSGGNISVDDSLKTRYYLLVLHASKGRAESILTSIQKEYPEEISLLTEGAGWIDTDYIWRFEEWGKGRSR